MRFKLQNSKYKAGEVIVGCSGMLLRMRRQGFKLVRYSLATHRVVSPSQLLIPEEYKLVTIGPYFNVLGKRVTRKPFLSNRKDKTKNGSFDPVSGQLIYLDLENYCAIFMANPVAVIGALVMIGNHWQSLGIIGKRLEITLRCINSLMVLYI